MPSPKKNPKTGLWDVQYWYKDYKGEQKHSTKSNFKTKKEADEWLHNFMAMRQGDFTMLFEDFVTSIYMEDLKKRLREHTMEQKWYVIRDKILPYFGKKKMIDITAPDIRAWQNALMELGYADTYLKTINNQLSAILNYAVRYYDLPQNPCHKAGAMGKDKADEVEFWTTEEFNQFLDKVSSKRLSYYIFETFYYTGLRMGELLALTVGDIDFDKKMLKVTKSLQVINNKEVITEPKTPKSKRNITLPSFLIADLEEYIKSMELKHKKDRLFPCTKYYLHHEMERGIKESGVKKIKLHALRHSHVTLLIELGFDPLAVAERLGHEKVTTTLNIYGHLWPNKQAGMADKLDALYKENFSDKENEDAWVE